MGIDFDNWKLAAPEDPEGESCEYCGEYHYYPEDGTISEEGLFFCNENCQESYEIDEEINQNK
jgi:hypothetical protein